MTGPENGAESVPWVLADALVDMLNEATEERDRYRLAWLSARRRAAREAQYADEVLSDRFNSAVTSAPDFSS